MTADTTRFLVDQAAAALTDEDGRGLVVDIPASGRLLTDQADAALTNEGGGGLFVDIQTPLSFEAGNFAVITSDGKLAVTPADSRLAITSADSRYAVLRGT